MSIENITVYRGTDSVCQNDNMASVRITRTQESERLNALPMELSGLVLSNALVRQLSFLGGAGRDLALRCLLLASIL